ncbi:PqqD family peptide modification chaperone [Streptomyces sp. JNUCC 64]
MLTPPAHVHWARTDEDATAVLDLRSGRWTVLDRDGTAIWHTLTEGGDMNLLAMEFAGPDGDLPVTRDAIHAYLGHLRGLGLLVLPPTPRASRWRRRSR